MPFKREKTAQPTQPTQQTWFIGLLLAAAVVAVYWQVLDCGFINYDDPGYVTSNAHIQQGLTGNSVLWAFTSGEESNWHPLTWLSHMLDFELFGLKPAGHHFTSLLLHIANAVLLFVILRRMTGKVWQSAAVAALFALHPLRVESVAWVSERKDVLSTLFWMLTVLAYIAYVSRANASQPALSVSKAPVGGAAQEPGKPIPLPAEPEYSSTVFYVLALVCFACGLMSKPMLVTLPFVLLLLDFWPLRRLQIQDLLKGGAQETAGGSTPEHQVQPSSLKPLLIEKTPFFAMALLSCVITFMVQQSGGAVSHSWPLPARLANAFVAYARYLGKTFWATRLAFFYPHPRHWPAVSVIAALVLLAMITAWVIARARRQPYLAVGWLWFVGMLAPTIGVVQVGMQSMADRYTYLPLAGVFIMLVWGLDELLEGNPLGKRALAVIGALAVALCGVLTTLQVGCWRDSETLFEHAINVTDDNYLAYYNLGSLRMKQGRGAEAFADFRKAVELEPDFAQGQNNWGKALVQLGRVDEALPHLEKAVQLQPRLADAHYNLGEALLAKGKPGEALDEFQRQVDLSPEDARAQENLANVLAANGLAADAIPFYERALRIQPNSAEVHYKLANIFEQQGMVLQAIAHYRQALQIQPDSLKAYNNLAWTLATNPQASVRNGAQAVQLARAAEQLSHGTNAIVLGTLAAAYAETGSFKDAATTAQRARELAVAQHNAALADGLERQLKIYEAGSPLRDSH